MDQVSYLGLRALGYGALVQFSWIYNRPVDLDGLRRFHHNLGYGLLGRRVERSPIPFARDHWVVSRGPRDLDIATTPRPLAEVSAWTSSGESTRGIFFGARTSGEPRWPRWRALMLRGTGLRSHIPRSSK